MISQPAFFEGKPHAMASSRVGEVALRAGSSPKCKWIFSREEMKDLASLKSGLDEFKELQFRQQSTKFIQLLGDRLNQPLRDHRGKITQLCMCAAMIHMHRFFYFHSFTFFDYRDVAAACLFLSGKSEECPRKIDHILRAWWSEKFPGIKLDQTKYDDAMGLLVAIESVILQTIAFDLQVALPHPLVLKAMHDVAKNNRKITEVVYFFSTDVLCVTSWGIRYSAEAIAVACVHIVCTWADFEMPTPSDGYRWYYAMDPTMTEELLQEMMREFISVYRTCKNDLAITKFIRKGEIRDPISDADSDRATPPALLDVLPPPPPPPLSLASKKVDINAYKERRAADGGASNSSSTHSLTPTATGGGTGSGHQQRRSFMPEMNQMKGVTASMPGFVLPKQEIKQEPIDRKPEFDSSYRSSSSSSAQRPSRPPSNGGSSGSGGVPPRLSSSSSSSHHNQQYLPYMQQQQPSGSGSGDRSVTMTSQQMERTQTTIGSDSRGRDAERSDKRKREMSASNLNSDKRSRTDMPMSGSGGGGGGSQRGHPMAPGSLTIPPSLSSSSQLHGGGGGGNNSYNSVPPPSLLMQQPPPMGGGGGYGSSKHYSGGPQNMMMVSNGHHQQQQQQQMQRSSYGSQQPLQPFQQQQQLQLQGSFPSQLMPHQGYGSSSHHPVAGGYHHMANGYGGMSVPPPPPPPPMATTGDDREDGEVF